MLRFCVLATIAALLVASSVTVTAADDEGFVSLFDGNTLTNWEGNPALWRVEDGAIVGQTTPDKPTKGNTFIIWTGGEVGDFEAKFDYRVSDQANTGLQYRSYEKPGDKWVVAGYQADIDGQLKWTGILYGEKDRGILAKRGEKVRINKAGKPEVIETLGAADELIKAVKAGDWNTYHVIAKGNHLTHIINGVKMVEIIDEDDVVTAPNEKGARMKGILAFQLHQGPPMKVEFKNIKLKKMD